MSENKIAKVPVASHGLHKHSYNYPWLSSINFGDVMPCYINTVRKGERDNPKAGVFSQLMPIAHNAFATGRYNFKGVFVPYKLVWRPWYSFDQQTEFASNGTTSTPNLYPYVTQGSLNTAFVGNYCTACSSTDPFDILLQAATPSYYYVNNDGRRVLRILGALGCTPSFIDKDAETVNILPILCYIKAYSDYYFPNNYVGNTSWLKLVKFHDRDTINFTSEVVDLLDALNVASLNFYENSIFDIAFDKPSTPNTYTTTPVVDVKDVTNDATYPMTVTNQQSGTETPSSASYKPANGTPGVFGSNYTGSTAPQSATGVITQYVLDVLKSVSMWAKRHQLAGARLLDRFLISRGITLGNDSARISYFIGQRNIEIQVSGVENNSNTNLGELAGRGIASSGDKPLSFDCRADDDGIFLVIVSPIPDSNFPVLFDGFSARKDFMDNYHAEYDKLGAAAVPARVVAQTYYGNINSLFAGQAFGFLNQYWDEVQERPRLLGDFLLQSKGAQQLSAYHTFRQINFSSPYHSYDFVRMDDASQYQRLFYSDEQENLMLFLRWYGDQYKEKLPLGDSYEWDDDEFNRKVSVVVGGSQK